MPDIASTFRYDEQTGRLHATVTTVTVDEDAPTEVVREGGYEIVKRPLTETTTQAVFLPTEVVERIIRDQVHANSASGGADRLLDTDYWRRIRRVEHDGRQWIDVTDLFQMGSDVSHLTGGAWCRDGIRSTIKAIEAWRPTSFDSPEPGRFYTATNPDGTEEQFVADVERMAGDGRGKAVWRLSSQTHGSLLYWRNAGYSNFTPSELVIRDGGAIAVALHR